MPAARSILASRFRRAMLYIIEQLGDVSVTKLQKLLYLSDLEHFNATGTTLTGARWVRYTYGPMAKALLPSTELMDGYEVTVSLESQGPYDARIYRRGPAPRFRPALAAEEREALDRVLAITRTMTATEAVRLAYNTGPMRVMLRLEEAGAGVLLDVEIPFDLDSETLVDASTDKGSDSPGSRARFKQRELRKIDDLQRAAASRTE